MTKSVPTPQDLSRYEFSENFWPEIIDKYWEQKPGKFKLPAEEPFLNLDELFAIVTTKQKWVPSDRLWIAKNSNPKHVMDFRMARLALFGPKKYENNFDNYFKRMAHHGFGVNVHRLQVRQDLWDRTRGFIKHLNKVPGRPPAKDWDLDTFFGTYRATPFGIHRDPASVFSFILQGERTYCTWDSDYFKKGDKSLQTPDLDVINEHLENAETFTIKPGEIFYWPSNSWHVVLSNGAPSVVVQISAYFDTKDLKHWD